MDRPTGTFIWTWAYAMAMARVYTRIYQQRVRVHGYRTGIPHKPWGYSVDLLNPARARKLP